MPTIDQELVEKILVHKKSVSSPESLVASLVAAFRSRLGTRNSRLFRLHFVIRRRHLHYRGFRHFHHEVVRRNPQMNAVILECHDGSAQSAARCHPVPRLQLIQHTLPFFLAALLGQNQKFARALAGTQSAGDAYVAATLEVLIEDPVAVRQFAGSPRRALSHLRRLVEFGRRQPQARGADRHDNGDRPQAGIDHAASAPGLPALRR